MQIVLIFSTVPTQLLIFGICDDHYITLQFLFVTTNVGYLHPCLDNYLNEIREFVSSGHYFESNVEWVEQV